MPTGHSDHQNQALGSSQPTDLHQFIDSPGPSMCRETDTTFSADVGATVIFERSVDRTPYIVSSGARLQTYLGRDFQAVDGFSGSPASVQLEVRHERKRLADESRDSCAAPPRLDMKSHISGSEESADIAAIRKGFSRPPIA